jgi:hypothetical protein
MRTYPSPGQAGPFEALNQEHAKSMRLKPEIPTSLPTFPRNQMTRRIRNRLFDLEIQAHSMSDSLSPRARRMLVELVGKRDALFWPWRCTTAPKHLEPMPAIYERQRSYLERSTGTMVKADGRGSWKVAAATRLELIGSRMVDAISSGGQVSSMVLTGLGEAIARALVGPRLRAFKDIEILWARLQRLAAERSPVSESRLFGQDLFGDPADWEHWFESVLPMLTSGVARATSDTQGRIYFGPTGSPPPEPIDVEIDSIPDADGWYLQAFEQERIFLDSLESGSEIFIPLPSGIGE